MADAARRYESLGLVEVEPGVWRKPEQRCSHGFHWATLCAWCWFTRKASNNA